MKETITPDMVETVQKILKHCAQFDGEEYKVNIFDSNEVAPCSLTQAFFPEIIDMALEHFKRKVSYSLVEWIEEEPKTNNYGWSKEKGTYLKNRPLPLFDWSIVK